MAVRKASSGLTCVGWKSHTCPFESGLHHRFVGTFHHPRPNRPPLRLVPRIVHERFSLAEILQRLLSSWQGQRRGLQFREQVKQGTRTAMLE